MADNLEHVLNEYVQAWAAHDVEKIVSFFADDGVYEDVGVGVVNRGKAAIRAFVSEGFRTFPDFDVKLTGVFVAGQRAASEWIMTGTHLGDSPGLPATGKAISIRGASMIEFAGDKIRRDSDYWDTASFLRQIGVLLRNTDTE